MNTIFIYFNYITNRKPLSIFSLKKIIMENWATSSLSLIWAAPPTLNIWLLWCAKWVQSQFLNTVHLPVLGDKPISLYFSVYNTRGECISVHRDTIFENSYLYLVNFYQCLFISRFELSYNFRGLKMDGRGNACHLIFSSYFFRLNFLGISVIISFIKWT